MNEETRRREDAAIRMEERFELFLKSYEKNEEGACLWRKEMEGRLTPLEDLVKKMKGPWRITMWIIAMVMAGTFYQIGMKGWVWLQGHFK